MVAFPPHPLSASSKNIGTGDRPRRISTSFINHESNQFSFGPLVKSPVTRNYNIRSLPKGPSLSRAFLFSFKP